MKQQLGPYRVKKRKEFMRIHRKKPKSFLNNCTVVQEQFLIFHMWFRVKYTRIVSSVVEQGPYKAKVGSSTLSRCTKLGRMAERLKAAVC